MGIFVCTSHRLQATDKATVVLRSQIAEVRAQLISSLEEVTKERDGRLIAEREFEKMKEDLCVLIDAEDFGSVDAKIKTLVSRRTETNMRQERREMEELKAALEQAMQELSSSKACEREAEDRAASNRLALAGAEKEAAAALANVARLSETVERLREQKVTVINSLRRRIDSLEDARELLCRSHEDQISSLKAELSHAVTEKDRFMHSLNEVESANAVLVSIQGNENGKNTIEQELAKLKIEKTQLLISLSESTAKTQQMIRAAVASNSSSCEAELILEKEMRQSVEMALVEKQSKLETLQKSYDEVLVAINPAAPNEGTTLNGSDKIVPRSHRRELNQLSEEINTLKNENKNLNENLTDLKSSNEKLAEKYRIAEIQARRAHREGHFETEVAAEVARLRTESSQASRAYDMNGSSSSTALVIGKNYSNGHRGGHGEEVHYQMTAEEMYDLIMDLKTSVKEERELYRELLVEHEDLLALLAQQDMEKRSLEAALSNHSGEKAVEMAIHEAEENAVEQFGEFVTLG
mmetsp:Transcript_48686/g.72249  ORF Transcript_48686/g.72249 Transcript_48686/m.72249 type:complete len:525 (+) Transcript_48686:88-1662(+)